MPRDIISQILSGTYPRQLKTVNTLMDITRTIRYYHNGGSFKGLKNIEGLTTYDIPADSFDHKSKKNGISMYARLRNAGDFILQSVESNITFVDEIVLMENGGSTDDTIEKCTYLAQKYPQKVKFFIYKPHVYKLFSDEHKKCPNNSVHNFSYASNYLLSKVSYKYACKLDDDHIAIPHNIQKICKYIRKNGLDIFLTTPLTNVQTDGLCFHVASDNYRSTFAGLFGDFGFHPVCPQVYFHSNSYTEGYIHNLNTQIGPLGFLHLKLLKDTKGLHNYHSNGHDYLKNYYRSKSHIILEKQYTDLLHHYGIYENGSNYR